ncbi:Crp/Fnr family transcriptional regulator [Bernardetia sp. MNP-M8]|uniref:Crp/Fnr family transcriptional regulator n=1 Tax=Bernardetia sp. MNP-M8 TaxID=3127470 RepID=UPI0030D3713D
MNQFREVSTFFKKQYPLNKHGLEELFSLFELKKIDKNTILLKENDFEKELRFLNKGIIREYYSTSEREININFYTQPQFITDLSAFNGGIATKKNQQSLTKAEVLSIDKIKFEQLLEKYQCGKTIIESSFQKLLKHKELLEYNRITKTPEELYQELFIYKKHWLELIPQYHIASFLNISPETLSRIRKRIS